MAGLVRYRNNDIVNDTKKVVTSTWSNNTNNLTNLQQVQLQVQERFL
jgi:hypothetical protein